MRLFLPLISETPVKLVAELEKIFGLPAITACLDVSEAPGHIVCNDNFLFSTASLRRT